MPSRIAEQHPVPIGDNTYLTAESIVAIWAIGKTTPGMWTGPLRL